jgi:23S rRNA (adenine2503-C2)-methyltransferase
MTTMPVLLKDLTSSELSVALASLGVSPHLARQLQVAAVKRDEIPESLPAVSAKLLERVRREVRLPRLSLLNKAVSPCDGFAKYLFRGDDQESYEAVRIPLLNRKDDLKYIVCVSSQAGCAMGCRFCATGRQGLVRDLAAWEIVDQVIRIQADSEHPVRGVVFMGMGEPLLNYESVIRAARILAEPCGMAIAGKAISISTSGIVPGIRRFTTDRLPFRLIVSLASADSARRREVMPVEATYPLGDLMSAIRDYHRVSGRRVTLAWPLISGFNTRTEDAVQLAELTCNLPITLDLIDVNDATGQFRPPDRAELDEFRDALRLHLKMPVIRRYSGGRDIHAACGMLAKQFCSPTHFEGTRFSTR